MKIGLVLSGGGGRGAYELGVWKALKELKIDEYIEVFSGTSIGAINSVLFLQDDLEKAQHLWDNITMEMLLPLSKFELMKKGIALTVGAKNMNFVKKYMAGVFESGGVSKDGLRIVLNNYIDIEKIKASGKVCYATCTEVPDFKVRYFKLNDYSEDEIHEIVMASASLPLIYEPLEIEEKKYLDGGMMDNTPIQPVYGEGCDLIIVILLTKDSKIDRSKYPNAKIIEIVPKDLDENAIDGLLNLDIEAKKMRIQHGYEDAMNLLEPIMEMAIKKNILEEKKKYPMIESVSLWFKMIKEKIKNISFIKEKKKYYENNEQSM